MRRMMMKERSDAIPCQGGRDLGPGGATPDDNHFDRMRGSTLRCDEPLAIVQLETSREPLARLLALLNETVLRVGSLELDLINRSARRGDRHIDLRPREFQLLKYMMQRSDKLLTRAALLKEVWHYKFVPKTNLVDVQMGLLRRKVDRANEAPMIRTVRSVGFVLDALAGFSKETSIDVRPRVESPSAIVNDSRAARPHRQLAKPAI
jgi:DNA-binding winged helix-turn-helix (wHTH) protein